MRKMTVLGEESMWICDVVTEIERNSRYQSQRRVFMIWRYCNILQSSNIDDSVVFSVRGSCMYQLLMLCEENT